MRAVVVLLLLALASHAPNLLLAAEPQKRTLIRSVPAGNVYSYENAAGETVEELENRQGKLISRHFYRASYTSIAQRCRPAPTCTASAWAQAATGAMTMTRSCTV
jgi:hypothetical protein